MSEQILLGYEVGTGEPVSMPLRHLVICGMTQLSGKTTTLEALIHRSELRAVAFKTKRGEVGFTSYHTIPPYFVEKSDWQYVSSLLEATLRERMKFERSWIMKACKGAKNLKDVYENVRTLKENARRGSLAESVYTCLEEYLKLVLPQIERFKFSDRLELEEGVNVMDLVDMSLEMRSLVIRSVMEHVIEELSNVIIIIPEAWEYIPQRRNNPVKVYAETFSRKGASVGNYLWVDSQDIAGIDKTPLRQCDVWILGRQKDAREVERTREEIFKNTPSAEEIMTLPLGHFYACIGDEVKLVYVQPSWLAPDVARKVALGEIRPEDVKKPILVVDDPYWRERYEKEVPALKTK
ncbi:MAG: hypothetical protein ACE5Z5_15505, partial [Candidatus Bathyarchaeia archaeon]